MLGWSGKILYSDDTLEDGGCVAVLVGNGHHTGTIDKVDSTHEGNVLPHFCLSGDGSDSADLFLFKRVDDAAFTDVGVADKPDRDLLLVRMQYTKLAQELNQRSLAKGIIDARVERNSRSREREMLDPPSLQ